MNACWDDNQLLNSIKTDIYIHIKPQVPNPNTRHILLSLLKYMIYRIYLNSKSDLRNLVSTFYIES